MTYDFWNDRFHWCVLAAGFLAASEGWLHDSERVKRLAYQWYEEGAFADRVPTNRQPAGTSLSHPPRAPGSL
jgi:hypothetical protein